MEKKIKEPKIKDLYEVKCLTKTSSFSEYVIAKNESEAIEKVKLFHPYVAISNIT